MEYIWAKSDLTFSNLGKINYGMMALGAACTGGLCVFMYTSKNEPNISLILFAILTFVGVYGLNKMHKKWVQMSKKHRSEVDEAIAKSLEETIRISRMDNEVS